MLYKSKYISAVLLTLVMVGQACGAKKKDNGSASEPLDAGLETNDGLTNPDAAIPGGTPEPQNPEQAVTSEPATEPNPGNSSTGMDALLQSFSLQGVSDQAITNQLSLSWSAASSESVLYDVALASDAGCETLVHEYNDIAATSVDLSGIADGSYYICLSAEFEEERLPASNSGLLVTFDTHPPEALESFAIAAKTAEQPAGTSALQLGTLELSISFPAAADDYERMELRYGESMPESCTAGSNMPLGSLDFGSDLTLEMNLSPGASYFFLACIWDAAGNLQSMPLAAGAITVPADHRVFLSSETFKGNMAADYQATSFNSGLEGADFRCQHLASEAGLGGRWSAVLSDDNNAAKDRITLHNGSVVDVMGASILATASSLWSDLDSGIRLNESAVDIGNVKVWTATQSGGESQLGSSCNNWSSEDPGDSAGYGLSGVTPVSFWLGGGLGDEPCDTSLRLYCIEQSLIP